MTLKLNIDMKKTAYYISMSFVAIAALIGGCTPTEETVKTADGSYEISAEQILQTKSTFLEDDKIDVGFVSDIEGAIDNAHKSALNLGSKGIDAVVIAGDCYENENIGTNPVYPDSTDNLEEMVRGIEPFAELGVPVFVIPGNHESRKIYEQALKQLQETHPNVFDINSRTADLQGLNIVGMGGYHDPRFTVSDGFILKKSDYEKAITSMAELQEQGEPTVFVTHGPPLSNSAIDYVPGLGHVGDKNIKLMMSTELEGIINIHGHIHEGGGSGAEYAAGIAINVAAVTDHNNLNGYHSGLLTIAPEGIDYAPLE